MLARSAGEEEVRDLFSRFGPVETVKILRQPDGTSRGCGFVKMGTRQASEDAIKTLHGIYQMPGATQLIIVRYADTEKQKQQKKQKQNDIPGPFSIPPPNPAAFPGMYGHMPYVSCLDCHLWYKYILKK